MLINQNTLHDRKIAILTADGFDELQLFSSKKALEQAGASVAIVSFKKGKIESWQKDLWSKGIDVDATLSECTSEVFDGLVIPGGENYSDNLFQDQKVSEFVKEFAYDGKTIASICNGTDILINSGITKKKTATSASTLKKQWRDDEVAVDNGIVTSRCPKESPAFIKKMIECFSISPRIKRFS